ncbi:MAG: VWA domain-containing protein [Pseudomonadota bacterium]|nr:VWA domain-containing protein [Pseudomonadota bacterium]
MWDLPLHFVRPVWLWLLLGLPLLAWLLYRRQAAGQGWDAYIDPALRPHVLSAGDGAAKRSSAWVWLLAWLLASLALAGPAWRERPQPLWQDGRALVVALDLSSATLAADLPPNRLLQARAKLKQLLAARSSGQTGLLAYADDAHTVSPLTDDSANIALFVDALAPEIMPVDGQQAARAIRHAQDLLKQAGASSGDIVLMTDHADAAANTAARAAAAAGYRVSVLGLGSAAGAEVRGRDGKVWHPRLDVASLQALAAAGGGAMAVLTADEGDLRQLDVLDAHAAGSDGEEGGRALFWQDEGYWLLLPLMLLGLWAFRRRGGAALASLLVLSLLWPMPAFPQERGVPAGGWWLRDDQAQYRVQREGDRAYRAGDYAGAAQAYARLPGAEARYNLGNALAKAGRYPEAVAAYEQALKIDSKLPDARENLAAVKRAMQQHQSQSGGQSQNQQGPGKPPAGDDQQDPAGQDKQPPPGERDQQNSQGGQGEQGQQGEPDAAPAQDQASEAGQPGQADAGKQPTPPAKPAASDSSPATPPATPPSAEAEAAQRAAAEAQREAMEKAMRDAAETAPTPSDSALAAHEQANREQQQAVDAWLRRIPDTPGDWLRQKFWIEHQRRRAGQDDR